MYYFSLGFFVALNLYFLFWFKQTSYIRGKAEKLILKKDIFLLLFSIFNLISLIFFIFSNQNSEDLYSVKVLAHLICYLSLFYLSCYFSSRAIYIGKDGIVIRNMHSLSYYPVIKYKDINRCIYSGKLYINTKEKYLFNKKIPIRLSIEEYKRVEEMINNHAAEIQISDE